jgi:N-6 DNA Methylase
MAYDPTAVSHQEWLGYVQPVGVVVSTPALLEVGAAINRNFVPLHKEFLAVLPQESDGTPNPKLTDFPKFATDVLGWRPQDLEGPDESLTIAVPGYEEVLHPDYAVKDAGSLLLLICKTGADFDAVPPPEPRHWHASPQAKFERLLRETGVPSGLLVSPDAIRLVYAPKGESSGHITFKIADMAQVAGRPILAALHMLLSAERLFTLAQDQRLPALLIASRKHQNVVSNKLSGQVMEALFDLLRGFQSAHDQTGVLTEVLRDDPNQVYAGLLTVLLRLVFILYAEDRDLLSSDETFINSYSVGGLFERLREDEAHHPDTMDQRYGAWARLVVLFRLIYKGARHGKLNIPGRKGYLFDPDRYPFLEGRPSAKTEEIQMPRVPDGVLYRVLRQLLILDGERLSYRNLDVEQIGSVYEAMMGFELHVAKGPSIALKPKKRNGAPITINLVEALAVAGSKRNDWLSKEADQKLTGQAECALKEATSVDDVMVALDKRIAKNVTPTIVPAEAMIFQPSAERRRSGSHYTPRSLTQPIVEAALAPVLKNIGENPKPEQILALKVCDPAMGSGAFLVEACRQLGDALVYAWHHHNDAPILPPDEDELLHARRLVAQCCLYGVDKNVMAVDLAKLSLWLATLARDHEFTFLDHSLRHGDSLIGLSAKQIAAFDWEPNPSLSFLEGQLRRRIALATSSRKEILSAREGTPYAHLDQKLGKVEEQLGIVRNVGDALSGAFFAGINRPARRNALLLRQEKVRMAFGQPPDMNAGVWLETIAQEQRNLEKPIVPFHWELEFPEVFNLDERLSSQGGFDTVVGNPPFAGKNTLIDGSPEHYIDWLQQQHPEAHGNSDLVAHFFRRAFSLLRAGGTFGLIATNTIAQGDTRFTGLRFIVLAGGTIYRARKRLMWPGEAAVVVSVIHIAKGDIEGPYLLDGRQVNQITAYLFHAGGNEDPQRLAENADKSYIGSYILGMGFTFDDTDTKGVASSLAQMKKLVADDPRNATRIFPYLGGEEVNTSPIQAHHRYVINFEDFPLERQTGVESWFSLSEEEQRRQFRNGLVPADYPGEVAADWPDLLAVIGEKVKPQRDKLKGNKDADRRRKFFWQWGRFTPALFKSLRETPIGRQTAVTSLTSKHRAFALVGTAMVFDQTNVVITSISDAMFAVISSLPHELWARFMASTLEDRLRYTPTDCFENFPFPSTVDELSELGETARLMYTFRSALLIRNNEGLTKTYNRFHNPEETSPDIAELRRLHNQMDRAVLEAYGWHDLEPVPAFYTEADDEDEEDEGSTPSRLKQKKHRYRWSTEMHDEVLARLLALNLERAALQKSPKTITVDKPRQAKGASSRSDQSVLF